VQCDQFIGATEYADFSYAEKALSFNPDGSKNSNNSALLTHDYITGTVME
jgi:hypothetical protein